MNRLISLLVLSAGLLVVVACGGEASPTPAATLAPTATASPSATPTIDPGIDKLTEESFRALLSLEDVEGVLVTNVPLNTGFINYREMAASVDPAQVVNMDSWYGLTFQTEDGMNGMTLMVVDFDSESSAQDHFELVTTETPELEIIASTLGDAFAEFEFNAQGIGSVLVFIKGDKAIQLHTSITEGQQPLVSLEGLEQLAGIVDQKLG